MTDDDDELPPTPTEGVTTERLRVGLGWRREPLSGINEREDVRGFGLSFSKRRPEYSSGFWKDLDPRARFYKRWFDFPDLGKRGWAIIFQDFPPPGPDCEFFLGWVPPEREAEADRWIAFMNKETKRLLREGAAKKAREASR